MTNPNESVKEFMEEKCKCPTCKSEVDLCPYCRELKPHDNKFCDECYELWKVEMDQMRVRQEAELAELLDKYNFKPPENPFEKIKEQAKLIQDKINEMLE